MIFFNDQNTQFVFNCTSKPTMKISSIHFKTIDINSVNRLLSARLTFIIKGLNEQGQMLKSSASFRLIKELITPKIGQHKFEANREIKFLDITGIVPDNQCKRWIASVEIDDMDFEKCENLGVSVELNQL